MTRSYRHKSDLSKLYKLGFDNDTSLCVNCFFLAVFPRHPLCPIWTNQLLFVRAGERQLIVNLNCFPQDYLEKEHPGLRQIIERCGGRYHVINNRQRQDREQICELLEKVRSRHREQLTEKASSVEFAHIFCNVYG